MGNQEGIETLSDVMLWRGIPEHLRSDNGPAFIALELRQWLANLGTGTLYIEPGSPWENGYCESFNGKLRDELLDREIFYTLQEAKVLIEQWRRHYNRVRPPSAQLQHGEPKTKRRRRPTECTAHGSTTTCRHRFDGPEDLRSR